MATPIGYIPCPGRPRVKSAERRLRKSLMASQRNRRRVDIGSNNIDRWLSLCDSLEVRSEELATLLLDNYEVHHRNLMSTPKVHKVPLLPNIPDDMSNVSSPDSRRNDIDATVIPALEKSMEVLEIYGSEDVVSRVADEVIDSDQFEDADADGTSSSRSESEGSEDEDAIYDDKDLTWQPSMSDIQLEEDSYLVDDQEEVCPDDMVLDANFSTEDGAVSGDEDEDTANCIKTGLHGFARQDNPREAATSEKAIACTSCLLQLATLTPPSVCRVKGCTSSICMSSVKKGTALIITWKCADGHKVKVWSSKPKLPRGILAGDFSLACCILLSGNNYRKIARMCKFLQLGCINASSFWRIQSLYCCPTINTFWEQHLAKVLEPLKGKEVIVAGDGRMDSPGFSAKYCTYTMINAETNDIVGMQITDKRQTDLKSTNMETKGFKDGLATLKEKGLPQDKGSIFPNLSKLSRLWKDYHSKPFQSLERRSFQVWKGLERSGKVWKGLERLCFYRRFGLYNKSALTGHIFYDFDTKGLKKVSAF